MKKKNTKTQNTSPESKSEQYNLRNRSISSDEKNLEKMFSQMKKEIIDQIYATVENIFNEHKSKIINTIIEPQNNENTPSLVNDKEDKTSKTQKSKKKNKDNPKSKESIEKNEIENENENKNIDCPPPKNTKSKKSHVSKKKTKKKNTKNTKKESSLTNGGEKTDVSSLNDNSKDNVIYSKVQTAIRSGKEELPLDNSLIGKKRKREIINPLDKPEVSNDKKKSKSKSKKK